MFIVDDAQNPRSGRKPGLTPPLETMGFHPPQRHIYFQDASHDELNALHEMRILRRFRESESVFFDDQGEKGFFYINAGYVKVVCRRGNHTEIVRIAGAGDLVGYGRWDSPVGRYGMVALSPVVASFFKIDDFHPLQARSPYISGEIMDWLQNLLMRQERYIFSMKFRTAKERVASALHALRNDFGGAIGGGRSSSSVPIDRKTLADLSGITIEVLSRVLGDLEQEGVILRQGRSILVANAQRLQTLATIKCDNR